MYEDGYTPLTEEEKTRGCIFTIIGVLVLIVIGWAVWSQFGGKPESKIEKVDRVVGPQQKAAADELSGE